MRLIDVTNSFANLVSQQLAHTDAQTVHVYSLGQTTVIFTKAQNHSELLLTNEKRNIQKAEVAFAIEKLTDLNSDQVSVIYGPKLAEISIPQTQSA
ncbi:DUF1827 family protein [Lacticaseibacillus brantae]|uniref:DUF1827 domain-containing protein n=1 Tax=Lacticaseibacillus brantae DSM 23927 TaxID=1423727 RepID=A0A0R2B8L4_9LACO|nr:DUF1827 family protein [Lacticaseibacillus brantae]KRM72454.1 hypothetical protein FC34_GL000159 [Lacticaseibacillus brantae DSM 23927]